MRSVAQWDCYSTRMVVLFSGTRYSSARMVGKWSGLEFPEQGARSFIRTT